ncbi:MAG: hypothetical protein QXJ69_06060 [Desulfurococcaceae archaeon]
MFTPIKFVAIISALSLIILMTYPLAVFIKELLENPECLKISIENVESINNIFVKAQVSIHYCSTIPLRDLRIVIGESEISFDTVSKGTFSKLVILRVNDSDVKNIEFKVAGLYGFKLRLR